MILAPATATRINLSSNIVDPCTGKACFTTHNDCTNVEGTCTCNPPLVLDDTEQLCVGKVEILRYLTGNTCDDNSLCDIIFPIEFI